MMKKIGGWLSRIRFLTQIEGIHDFPKRKGWIKYNYFTNKRCKFKESSFKNRKSGIIRKIHDRIRFDGAKIIFWEKINKKNGEREKLRNCQKIELEAKVWGTIYALVFKIAFVPLMETRKEKVEETKFYLTFSLKLHSECEEDEEESFFPNLRRNFFSSTENVFCTI